MNCFNHQSVPSVGQCKHCAKGLCNACVVDLDHGLSCHDHQQEVQALRDMILRARSVNDTNTQYKYFCPLLLGGAGAMFILFGILYPMPPASTLTISFGIGLSAFGVLQAFVVRKAFGKSACG